MRIEFDLRKMKRKDGTVSTKSLWTGGRESLSAKWKSGWVDGWLGGWVVQSMSRSIVAAIEQLSYANLPEACHPEPSNPSANDEGKLLQLLPDTPACLSILFGP